MVVDWQGVMPALMTELTESGELNLEATAAHLRACLDAGAEGVVVLGTLGENTSLSAEEKLDVVRCAVEAAAGRAPVLAGVAEYTTREAIEFAARAGELGVSGLMAMPCMVYEQDSREALTHFRALASSTTLPIMIYNNPVSYNVDLSPSAFRELADCENLVAVKESSHDSRRMTDMKNLLGDRFRLFCGVDDLALENLLFGAVGWVAGMANPFPREAVQLYRLARVGRIREAVDLYRWFMPLLHLDTSVKLVQYIKLANQITGLGAEWVRAPRLRLEGEERARIESIVRAGIESRPELVQLIA
jgi:1-pyrroline-4-hydroxy-2-carboxylate deaminase